MVDVLHRSTPKARTEHDCSMCGRTIRKGEVYERQDNVFDGRRYAFKCCEHCRAASDRAIQLNPYDYYDEGINRDYIEQVLCDDRETLADIRMLIHFRRRWTRRDGSLWPVPQPTGPGTSDG